MMGESAQPGDDHPGGEIDVRSNLIGHASPRLSEATTGPTTVGPMDSARWARRTTTRCERRSPSAPIRSTSRPSLIDPSGSSTCSPTSTIAAPSDRCDPARSVDWSSIVSYPKTALWRDRPLPLSGRLTDPRCGPFDVSLAWETVLSATRVSPTVALAQGTTPDHDLAGAFDSLNHHARLDPDHAPTPSWTAPRCTLAPQREGQLAGLRDAHRWSAMRPRKRGGEPGRPCARARSRLWRVMFGKASPSARESGGGQWPLSAS